MNLICVFFKTVYFVSPLSVMSEIRFDDRLVVDLLDAQPQPVFWMKPIWDTAKTEIIDFEYAYCNKEMYAYTGIEPSQLLGNRFSTSIAVNEDLKKRLFPQLKEVYWTGNKMEDTIFNPVFNKYYSFIRTKVADGVLTIIQDRSKEYAMIQELERQQSLINNVLTYSPSGISVTEVIRNEKGDIIDGRTILVNDAVEQYLSLPKEQHLTKTIVEIDPNILEQPVFQLAVTTLNTGEPFHTQYFFEPTKRWIELSVAKMDNDHLINVFSDITQTKESELKLKQSEEKLRTIINTSQAGVFMGSPVMNNESTIIDFRFTMANYGLAVFTGQSPEALIGELGSQWFERYKTNGMFEALKNTYLSGNPQRFDFHYKGKSADAWVNIMLTRLQDEILGIFTDYTPVKKLQLELEKSIEDLQRSNSNLEEFAYAASHDLKEPIRKVNFFTDRLRTQHASSLNHEGVAILDRLTLAAERMNLLIDNLLEYSHIGLRPNLTEDVDLNKKLHLVCGDLELLIEEKKANINIHPLPIVKGYRRQLQQLFQNLIGNALKYSKPDIAPVIEVTSQLVEGSTMPVHLPAEELTKSFYLIQVKDNGIGFDQQDADRIFNVFQRLHGNSQYKGTGIGLSIARKVAENHHGHIWASSEPGKGATFNVLLPASEATASK